MLQTVNEILAERAGESYRMNSEIYAVGIYVVMTKAECIFHNVHSLPIHEVNINVKFLAKIRLMCSIMTLKHILCVNASFIYHICNAPGLALAIDTWICYHEKCF